MAMSLKAVRVLEVRRIQAMLAGDDEVLRGLISPDCSYVHSNGSTDTGDSYTDKVGRGVFRYVDGAVDEQSVALHDGTAVVVYRFAAHLLIGGEEVTSVNRCTAVWGERAGEPRLIAFHSSPLPNNQR
ncbi:nuclear transport factor 2 family protein [Streptomyces sp. cg40]|uniref:nuclear transport factor 2 family protein n=1 Tax=Streptomyces sp. cg40 TaxID=3419764 RepID=UPI003D0043CE